MHYSKGQELVIKLGTALIRAVDEHGAPNTFGFSELVGVRLAGSAGREVRKHWIPFCLNVATRRGIVVRLDGGRLCVTMA